jgi:DNA-binding transcriptional MerR regulator
MRIDELAREAGLTSRNVRAYQQQGLIPPPEVHGRVGYYGEAHLERLNTVMRLRDRGYSLPAIRDLLAAREAEVSLRELLAFEQAARVPWHEEEPESATRSDLERIFPVIAEEPDLLAAAEEAGLIRPSDDGGFEVLSPRLLAIGAELTRLGLPLREVLAQATRVRENAGELARGFVDLFVAHLDAVTRGTGDGADEDLTAVLERLRTLTREAVSVQFARAVDEAVGDRRAGLYPRG